MLLRGKSNLQDAYRKANKIEFRDEMPEYESPEFTVEYYSFLKELELNNPLNLYSSDYLWAINNARHTVCQTSLNDFHIWQSFGSASNYQRLIASGKLTPEEIEFAKYLKKGCPDDWDAERINTCKNYGKSYAQYLIGTGKLQGRSLKFAKSLTDLSEKPENNVETILNTILNLSIDLSKGKIFSQQELESISKVIAQETGYKQGEPSSHSPEFIEQFIKKYQDSLQAYQLQRNINETKKLWASILGEDRGIAFDLLEMQTYASGLEERKFVEEEVLKQVKKMSNPFYYNYLTMRNKQLAEEIERDKKSGKYNVHTLPQTENDKILYEIVKPFAGKVIFIDFWATWCGPCLGAMKEFAPVKKQFDGKDIVFIYLTDESSPQKTWENVIPAMHGEHFRLKTEQFEYLKAKYSFRGIPSYLIINKTGDVIYSKTGYDQTGIVKTINEALAK